MEQESKLAVVEENEPTDFTQVASCAINADQHGQEQHLDRAVTAAPAQRQARSLLIRLFNLR